MQLLVIPSQQWGRAVPTQHRDRCCTPETHSSYLTFQIDTRHVHTPQSRCGLFLFPPYDLRRSECTSWDTSYDVSLTRLNVKTPVFRFCLEVERAGAKAYSRHKRFGGLRGGRWCPCLKTPSSSTAVPGERARVPLAGCLSSAVFDNRGYSKHFNQAWRQSG